MEREVDKKGETKVITQPRRSQRLSFAVQQDSRR